MSDNQDDRLGRGRFLQRAIFASAGFIGGVIGLPTTGLNIFPALMERSDSWVDIASAASFTAGTPQKADYVTYKKD